MRVLFWHEIKQQYKIFISLGAIILLSAFLVKFTEFSGNNIVSSDGLLLFSNVFYTLAVYGSLISGAALIFGSYNRKLFSKQGYFYLMNPLPKYKYLLLYSLNILFWLVNYVIVLLLSIYIIGLNNPGLEISFEHFSMSYNIKFIISFIMFWFESAFIIFFILAFVQTKFIKRGKFIVGASIYMVLIWVLIYVRRLIMGYYTPLYFVKFLGNSKQLEIYMNDIIRDFWISFVYSSAVCLILLVVTTYVINRFVELDNK